jgi:hypothetical protein
MAGPRRVYAQASVVFRHVGAILIWTDIAPCALLADGEMR